MSKKFTLTDYIDHKTGAQVARELGIEEQTVYYWKHKRSVPRPHTAAKLINLTGGLLTWESIYQPFVDHNIEEQLKFDFKD